MQLKKLGSKDSKSIAELHERAFPSFFLTSLGREFLEKFYHSILKDSNGLAVGIFEDEELVSFAVGAIMKEGFYKRLLYRNAFQLFFAAFPKIFRNPLLMFRLAQSFASRETIEMDISEGSRLLSICVDPSLRKKGYGRCALMEFESEVAKVSSLITLTTDAEKNDSVNKFYLSHGYALASNFFISKRKMNLYIKSFKN